MEKSPVLDDTGDSERHSSAPVLYFTVLHLIVQNPFLNFPLWSCPAL